MNNLNDLLNNSFSASFKEPFDNKNRSILFLKSINYFLCISSNPRYLLEYYPLAIRERQNKT